MATCFDVAQYILNMMGPQTSMKLQKLVYYSQAWSLVWDEEPLFNETIEAWGNGPVIRELFDSHRGKFKVSRIPEGDPDVLTPDQKETIDAVIDYYGSKPSQWLSDLTHSEDPWKHARGSCPDGGWCNNEITLASMEEYYSSLQPDD
jgi:uncharacterized phage-associated protein